MSELFFCASLQQPRNRDGAPVGANGQLKSMNVQPASSSAKKILVVDDSQVILQTLSTQLRSLGYQVFTAIDGSQAATMVRTNKPDLILLDLFFPIDVAFAGGGLRDGFLIIQWLRHLPEGKDVPVIIISGGNPEKYKSQSLAAGAVAFFHKPINHEELLIAIRAALGENMADKISAGQDFEV